MDESWHFFFSSLSFFGWRNWAPTKKKHPVFWGPLRTELWKDSWFPKRNSCKYPSFFAARICRSLMNRFLPCRKLPYPTWRKGNSSFKSAFKGGYVSSLEGNYWGFVFHKEAVCCRFDFLGQNSHRYNIQAALL